MSYFTPLIGAMIADSYWGKYKTILWLSMVYLFGMVLLAVSAIPFDPNSNGGTSTNTGLCLTALVIVAFGTGGIKPCVVTLGGDQFDGHSEKSRKYLEDFFSIFYFAINAGSLCSTFITPILRESTYGYPLAFGVPAVLMGVAILAFVFGTKYYTRKAPPGVNIFSLFWGATWTAIKQKCKTPKTERNKVSRGVLSRGNNEVKTAVSRTILWTMPLISNAMMIKNTQNGLYETPNGYGQLSSCTYRFHFSGLFLTCRAVDGR